MDPQTVNMTCLLRKGFEIIIDSQTPGIGPRSFFLFLLAWFIGAVLTFILPWLIGHPFIAAILCLGFNAAILYQTLHTLNASCQTSFGGIVP